MSPTFRTPWSLLVLLVAIGCGDTTPGERVLPDDDDATGDDDTSSDDDTSISDDDTSSSDDDTSAGDDDTSTGDDDTSVGDDDTSTGDDDTSGDDDSAPAVPVGAIVITEIFNNAQGVDDNKEWIEIHNTTTVSIPLAGFTVSDSGTDSFTISGSLSISPGAYLVLGQSTDVAVNGGIVVAAAWANDVILGNDADEIILSSPAGTVIDTVAYDDSNGTFPGANGESMSLDPSYNDAAENDDGSHWCLGTTLIAASGALASPGVANPSCGGSGDDDTASGGGDIVITEIFNNPSGADDDKEWFEVHNLGTAAINLQGWTIADLGTDSHVIATSLVVAPGSYVLLGETANTTLNGGVTLAYAWGTAFGLANNDDEVILKDASNTVVDQVVYNVGSGFPNTNGQSMSLDPASVDTADNDDDANWCLGVTPFGSTGALGTPAAANPSCGASPGDDDSATNPSVALGDLVISEIFNNATGADTDKEWFEVQNVTAAPIDLDGFVITDFGTDNHTVASSVIVPANGRVVLGNSRDVALNGGAAVDYAYGSSVSLGNTDDEIVLTSPDGLVIDQVVYVMGSTGSWPTTDGESLNLSPTTVTATGNDSPTNWCLSTASAFGSTADLGSPGVVNPACGAAPVDTDGDGTPDATDCDDNNPAIEPGATETACDGIDQDCSGADLAPDVDADGTTTCAGDCNDNNANVEPGATEVPGNGVDDDCDSQIDEVAAGCGFTEVESNNTLPLADPITFGTVVCGTADPSNDLDLFSIVVSDWTTLTLDLTATSLGSPMDTFVRLLDGNGDVVATNDDGPSGIDSLLVTTVWAPGTYYVEVTDYNLNGGSTYDYQLVVTQAAACQVSEVEPNDSLALADFVTVGQNACGDVSGSTDYDTFEFTATAGMSVDFTLDAYDYSGLGGQLFLYDSSGTELASDEPGAFDDPSLSYTFTTAGTYYIEVASDWVVINSSGAYLLHLVP